MPSLFIIFLIVEHHAGCADKEKIESLSLNITFPRWSAPPLQQPVVLFIALLCDSFALVMAIFGAFLKLIFGTTNPGAVLSGTGVDDGIDDDLEGVLPGKQVDDLEAMLHNPHRQQLLTIVSAVHHQRVAKTLNNRTLSLAEALGGIPSSGVGKVLGILLLHGNVVLEGHVRHLHVLTGPLPKKLDLRQLGHHGRWLFNVVHRDLLISPVVTHFELSCRSESSNKSLV